MVDKLDEATHEKEKGPAIGKLCNVILIEVALEIRMRMFLDLEKEELIDDKRFSKANFNSRQKY